MESQSEHQPVEVSKIFEELDPQKVWFSLTDIQLSLLHGNLIQSEFPLGKELILNKLPHA